MTEVVRRQSISAEEELICRVAWLYYREQLTQEEISTRVGIPRIKVSRLIDKGHQLGIIQVQINSSFYKFLQLEADLTSRFNIEEARVVPSSSDHTINENLSFEASKYLSSTLKKHSLLAIGWGDTVTKTLQKIGYFLSNHEISLISLSGGVSAYLHGLTGFNADQTNIHLIPAPILTSSAEVASAIKKEPQVREVLAMVPMADCAVVGIGAVVDNATIVHSGYVKPEEISLYQRLGAVGDLLGQFYDSSGNLLNLPLHDRITGADLETLKRIPRVIGIAGGSQKTEAIRGALTGGLISILITDEATAIALIGGKHE